MTTFLLDFWLQASARLRQSLTFDYSLVVALQSAGLNPATLFKFIVPLSARSAGLLLSSDMVLVVAIMLA